MKNEIPQTLIAFIRSIQTAPQNEITLSEQYERGRHRTFKTTHGFPLLEAQHLNAEAEAEIGKATWTH